MNRRITEQKISDYKSSLKSEEKSQNTIDKYIRDVRKFKYFMKDEIVTKEHMMNYKQNLIESGYCFTSINSMLSSLNSFYTYMGWNECKVKFLKVQRQVYASKHKELSKKE